MKARLKALVDLLFSRTDSEATAFPFWYVAEKGGFGRTMMVSRGIWFSREAAEKHLEAKAYRYGKKAFVYCDSAHDSYGGLRELYRLAEEAKRALESEDTPEHRLDNYQHFLGRIADAAGCSGSPTLEEVLERVRKMELGLRNCSALAKQQLRRRTGNPGTENLARNIERFCSDAGVEGSILR